MTRIDAILDSALDDEQRDLRESARRYMTSELAPRRDAWIREGVPVGVFAELAELGFVAMAIGEEHGGAGVTDPRFGAVVAAEAVRAGMPGLGLMLALHSDACVPALAGGPDIAAQQALAGGKVIAALVELEPSAEPPVSDGSLKAEAYSVVNGGLAELFVCCDREAGTAYLAHRASEGIEISPVGDSIGPRECDLADLRFDSTPVVELEGSRRPDLRAMLAVAVVAAAGAARSVEVTGAYVAERRAFGTPIASFENTQVALGGLIPELAAAEAAIGAALRSLDAGELDGPRAAVAKRLATRAFDRAVDWGIQLHGGYGYMFEYEIAHLFVASRLLRLLAGGERELDAALSPASAA